MAHACNVFNRCAKTPQLRFAIRHGSGIDRWNICQDYIERTFEYEIDRPVGDELSDETLQMVESLLADEMPPILMHLSQGDQASAWPELG